MDTIGIVGGMGPQAGVGLFNSVLSFTQASRDQDHLPVVLMSFPNLIGDRTAFLDGEISTNPAHSISEVIRKLEAADAKVVAMACNSAHAPPIYDVVVSALRKRKSGVKLLHMPFETCRYISDHHKNVRRIGVMSTNGTYKTRLYEQLITQMGCEVVLPPFQFQNEVIHRMIYDEQVGLKSKNHVTEYVILLASRAIDYFRDRKADAIILGCTELPMAIREQKVNDMLIFDSTAITARALIREATRKTPVELEYLP
ncbi:MAG: aspartate/glutamate racemase family protein [Chryseotalea sp. WA131a]|nr:MAG: aspartate/glutamate racemase family protein [Chryseotalea sp. WA131a]